MKVTRSMIADSAEIVKFVVQMELSVEAGGLDVLVREDTDEKLETAVTALNRIIRAAVAYRDIYANEQLRRLG